VLSVGSEDEASVSWAVVVSRVRSGVGA